MAFSETPVYLGPIALQDIGSVNQGNSVYTQRATLATRPATGNRGILFVASDDANGQRLYWDDGAAWQDLGLLVNSGAQTFAGAKTFSGALTLSGATGNILVVDTNVLVVDATNNKVGIGTATPDYPLDVRGRISSRNDVNGVNSVAFSAENLDATAVTLHGVRQIFLLRTTTSVDFEAGEILVGKKEEWTAGAGTRNAFMAFSVLRQGTPTERLRITDEGNLGYGTTDQFGGGSKVIGIANAASAPSVNPTGGGVLYAEAGALKWRGSSGTITTIAAA